MSRVRSDRNGRSHKKHVQGNHREAKSTKTISDCYDCEVDIFDFEVPINRMTDLCRMCNGDQIDGELMQKSFPLCSVADDEGDSCDLQASTDDLRDPENVWVSKYSLKQKHRCFVHYNCALYSPQASYDGLNWSNVRKEMVRGRCFECYNCHKKGPTLKCSVGRCSYIVHFPCALKEGYTPSRFQALPLYYCPTHTKTNEEEEKRLDRIVLYDMSLGREKIPVIMVNEVDNLPFPTEFEYITINVDSDNILATTQHACEDNFPCCDCVGLCNDVNTCACLKAESQRNYSSHGLLIAGSRRPILECNVRCGCSISRCTNRVVERGPQYPLQLFRIKNELPSKSSSALILSSSGVQNCTDNEVINAGVISSLLVKNKRGSHLTSSSDDLSNKAWGVKTLEDIPEGSFVCEITGQYVDLPNISTSEKVKEFLNRSKKSSQEDVKFTDFLKNRVVPISLWEAPNSLTSSLNGRSSGIDMEEVGINSVQIISYPNNTPSFGSSSLSASSVKSSVASNFASVSCNADSAVCGGGESLGRNVDTGKTLKLSIDHIGRNAEMVNRSTGQAFESNRSLNNFLGASEKAVRNESIDLCLDCNLFGNIGRFIRHGKETRKSVKKLAVSGPSSTSRTVTSATSAGSTAQPMLMRRLVYTDASDRRYPKLAIFASQNIPANTELIF